MASFSDHTNRQAARQTAPSGAGQASAPAAGDDWYDQGFDLNDETQYFDYAQSGINPDLIPSAEQKLEASEYNQVRSDAKESLQSGNLKLDITQVGQIASGAHAREHGPRHGTIMVGGQGKIEDIPTSLSLEMAQEGVYTDAYKEKARQEEAAAAAKAQAEAHASVYNDAYLAQKDQAAANSAAEPNYVDEASADFATRVSHQGGLSEADLRFLQAQRLKENQAPEGKAVLPPDSAKINERTNHVSNANHASNASPARSAGHAASVSHASPAGSPARPARSLAPSSDPNERLKQQAQARRDEQRAARARRQQQLQESQARLQQQQAQVQARTEAAANRLQRAQARREEQEAQAARAARPDENYLQHQAAAMLYKQEQQAAHSDAAIRAHNLALAAQHKEQRAAALAQRNKEHRDQMAATMYAKQAQAQAKAQAAAQAEAVAAPESAPHRAYQYEPVEEVKPNSALDSLQAQGEAIVPVEDKKPSALDAVGSGAELMEQEPVDPDAPSSAFNALQDGSFALQQAQAEQANAQAQAQYEAEVAARASDVQARLAQIEAERAHKEAERAQQEHALADEFDAWTHERGGAVDAHLSGHQRTRSLDDYENLHPTTHQRTKSIYDFKDLRTAEHHRTKSLDDFQDISAGQRGFMTAQGRGKDSKFFAPPQGKALPVGGLVATHGARSRPAPSNGASIEEHDYGSAIYGSSIGDSALEQDAHMHEYADTDHAFEVLSRKGQRMAYGRNDARVANNIGSASGSGNAGGMSAAGISAGGGAGLRGADHGTGLDFIPQHKPLMGGLGSSDYLGPAQRGANVATQTQTGADGGAPTRAQSVLPREQLSDMSTAGHRARGEKEKSLEELAREYPGLSMKHLVKLKRSSNRCHLVSRTPIFDAASNIAMYELKFTAGKVFQVNALKSEHVYHVLFGYFIRRGISCFIGRNRHVLVMMPLTYDFVDYLERYSVNRVLLRICPEQPVTPSALHLLTQLRRNGMSFAIDLMLLIKKEWNKAILSIEYVMIDMSDKVNEQLNVFQRLKSKAPWLKTIGFNDTKGDGYAYLAKRMIDFLDAPLWNPPIVLNQDIKNFAPVQNEVLTLIRELFKDQPNYTIFQRFLKGHDAMARDMAVFLYRFRHASPRQVQNISELYNFLLEYSANRCFSVMAARSIMLAYIKAANHPSQNILQEHYVQALVRGYFCEYISKVFNDPFVERFGFQSGMFSLLHMFLLQEEVDVIANDSYNDIFDRIYGDSELMADIIECVQAIEATDLMAIFSFIQKYQVPPASVLISYEKALMRTNELLLVLNITPSRK